MPEGGDQHRVRIIRIDQDLGDLLGVRKADGGPMDAAVGGSEHADALSDVRAHVGLAGADVEHGRFGRGHGDGADGAYRRVVEDRGPGAAGVLRLPDPAVHRAEVEVQGAVGGARYGQHPPAPEGADGAPAQGGEGGGIGGARGRPGGGIGLGSGARAESQDRAERDRRCV